jgi:uncharacterized membrane protein
MDRAEEAIFKLCTDYLASCAEGIAGLIIAFATLRAMMRVVLLFRRIGQPVTSPQEPQIENIRLRSGLWLTLALEFEPGADVLRTVLVPIWMEIGQLAAIATIQTLLN